MNIKASAIVTTALGVLVAGAVLFYLGDMPLISDARKGFDGRKT